METVICCCGSVHQISTTAWKGLAVQVAANPTTLVGNAYGCWRVPRLFLVFHDRTGLAVRLRSLALKYGWEEYRYIREEARS